MDNVRPIGYICPKLKARPMSPALKLFFLMFFVFPVQIVFFVYPLCLVKHKTANCWDTSVFVQTAHLSLLWQLGFPFTLSISFAGFQWLTLFQPVRHASQYALRMSFGETPLYIFRRRRLQKHCWMEEVWQYLQSSWSGKNLEILEISRKQRIWEGVSQCFSCSLLFASWGYRERMGAPPSETVALAQDVAGKTLIEIMIVWDLVSVLCCFFQCCK